jgi:hypothetical protein
MHLLSKQAATLASIVYKFRRMLFDRDKKNLTPTPLLDAELGGPARGQAPARRPGEGQETLFKVTSSPGPRKNITPKQNHRLLASRRRGRGMRLQYGLGKRNRRSCLTQTAWRINPRLCQQSPSFEGLRGDRRACASDSQPRAGGVLDISCGWRFAKRTLHRQANEVGKNLGIVTN